MTKEVQMTIRIEPELRDAFAEAALQEHRPSAQVVRELMRAYVAQARERGQVPAHNGISAAERQRREAAVSFARASVGLEGFKPSDATEAQAQRFIAGDIPLSDFVRVKPDAEQAPSR
jgi:hypothetical protein